MTFLDVLFWSGMDMPFLPGHAPALIPLLTFLYYVLGKHRRGELAPLLTHPTVHAFVLAI